MLWLYSKLLLLYPSSFRHEYGAEMSRIFARRLRQSSIPSAVLLWIETLPDIAWHAFAEHAALLRQDARFAVRAFRRAPGYALTAIVTVALGIAASTAMFTAVDHILLRPLPFPEPDRLVKLWEGTTQNFNEPSPPNYDDWKRQSTVFGHMAAYRFAWSNLTGTGTPERLEGVAASWDLFPVLKVQPLLGRTFKAEEDGARGPNRVILMHSLWQRRFASDPAILGRKILMNGEPYEVIGVMAPGFHFPRADIEFFVAMRFTSDDFADRNNNYLQVIARLKNGVSIEAARAEILVVGDRVKREHPEAAGSTIAMKSLRDEISPSTRTSLYVLLGAAACVLLLGCANLANLLLARASERRKELAVRAMLGAGRERLTRQILTENLLLSMAGGGLGMLLANASLPLLVLLIPTRLPILKELHLDGRLLLFGIGLSLLTGLLFAWIPAWRLSREADLSAAAKDGGRVSAGLRRQSARKLLVAGEVAVSVVLLVAASLLFRTLLRITSLDPGFQPEGVLTMRTVLPQPKYLARERRVQFYRQVLTEVRALPGVESAGYTSFLPLTFRGGVWPVVIMGKPDVRPRPQTMFRVATPGYLEAMRIPVLRGRTIQESDLPSAGVVVVSEFFARQHWPGENPLGRMVGLLQLRCTVIGVVSDVRIRGLENSLQPQVYVPHTAIEVGFWHAPKDLAVRARGNPMALAPAIRDIIRRADPDQPVDDVRLMSDWLIEDTSGRRAQIRLLGAFTALAFLLAAIGLHGLMSFLVSQRTQEIGVRMALGARSLDVLRIVFTQGVTLALIGTLAGVIASVWVARAMARLLYEVRPLDLSSFAASVAICLFSTAVACYLPARRASKVDPMCAMRAE